MGIARRHLIRQALPACLVAAALLPAAGCASSGTADPSGETVTEETAAPETATTVAEPPPPPPITAAERAWLQAVKRYETRFQREVHRSGAITHASMSRDARLYGDCAKTLRRAGDPGRYAPAARMVARACERLTRAEGFLEEAIAASDVGGSVVAGTPEEAIFERALNGAQEAAGNAGYRLERAVERADGITLDVERGR